MPRRILISGLLLLAIAPLAWSASVEEARRLHMAGDTEGARRELSVLIKSGGEDAQALLLLGRIEADSGRWTQALAAWSDLTEKYSESPEARAVDAALGPLRALADCGCSGAEAPSTRVAEAGTAPPAAAAETPGPDPAPSPSAAPPREAPRPAPTLQAAPAPSPPAEPPAPTVESAPAPVPGSAAGRILVGGWSKQFESSQEATRAMFEFLDEAGVAVQFVPTDVAAARGEEVTLSFLLDQAEESGASGVLFFTARFTHRDYVLAEYYDPRGTLLWKEKIHGGTELRPKRERGQVRWALVERMQKKLGERIGTPELPVQ